MTSWFSPNPRINFTSTKENVNSPRNNWTTSTFVEFFTRTPVRFFVTLLVVFTLGRVATWGYPYDSDHWIFYYVGHNWIVDGGQLYVGAWDHKPPLIFLYNGIMAALFGDNIVLHRIWFTLFAVVDIVLFYLVTKRVMPKLLAAINSPVDPIRGTQLTLILYVFLRNLSQFASNGNTTENLGLVFLLGMIWAYLKFTDTRSWGWIALSGFFVANLFWVKGNLILLGGVIGLLLLIHGWKKAHLVWHVIAFIAPIVIVSLIWIGYFASQGTFQDFITASFSFSAKYASSAWAGKVSANILLILITAAMLVPALIFFALYLRDFSKQYRNEAYQLIGMSFLVGLGLIAAVGSFYSYYLLIIMPFITLVMMYGMFRLDSLSRFLRVALSLLFIATIAINGVISLRFLANNFGGITKQEAIEYTQAANYVNEHTNPNDRVIAYDYGATFYQLAGRESASRFISASHLLLDTRDNFGFGFDDIFLTEVESAKAPYIVINERSKDLYFTNKPVADYIKSHYTTVKKFGNIEVLERTK